MPPIYARFTYALFASFSVSFASAAEKPAPLPILISAPMIYDAWHMPTQRALMVCAMEADSLRLEDSLARMDPHSVDDCSNRSDSLHSTTGIQNLPQHRWIGVAKTAGRSDRDAVEEIRDCANELGCKFGDGQPLFYDLDGDGFHEAAVFNEPNHPLELNRDSFFEFFWKDSLFVHYRSLKP